MEPEFTLQDEPGYEQCREAEGTVDADYFCMIQKIYHEGLLFLDGLEAAVTKL